jgi:hypothetical protein
VNQKEQLVPFNILSQLYRSVHGKKTKNKNTVKENECDPF